MSLQIIRPGRLAKLLGVSLPTLYRWEAEGRLPPRLLLGPNTSGWREDEIMDFLKKLPTGSRAEEMGVRGKLAREKEAR